MAVYDFRADFPTGDACLEYLWRAHHAADGRNAYCPKCRTTRPFHRIASRPSYSCARCGRHVHPTAGTIFHKSRTPLLKWWEAIYWVSATGGKVSAKELQRRLRVTYKSAWRMRSLIVEHCAR